MLLIHLKLDYPLHSFLRQIRKDTFKESNFLFNRRYKFMNKTDLIDAIANAAELNKKTS